MTQVSIDRLMDKQNVVYTQRETLLSHKKRGNWIDATIQMNLKDTMLSQTSQSQKDRYGIIPLTGSQRQKGSQLLPGAGEKRE